MSDLAELIDRLPPPEINSSLSPADKQLIELLIKSARQQLRPYTGNYRAAWLLVPFEQNVWHTTNRGREELVNGEWKSTVMIDWRVRLPNGFMLTDARYAVLLTTLKRISFLIRSNLTCGKSTPGSLAKVQSQLIVIGRWMILHEGRFQAESHGLRLIDQSALDWFFGEYAQGGIAQLLQIPQRVLAALYLGAHGTSCPPQLLQNIFSLPTSTIGSIVRWIESQGGYRNLSKGQYAGKKVLGRVWLGRLIHEDTSSLQGSKMLSRFFRQFEPDFSKTPLLVSISQTTEFPSHRTSSTETETEGASEKSLHQIAHLFRSVLDAHRHLPSLLPDPANLSLRRANNLAQRFTRAGGHTPFMPVNTGLAYLKSAVRFVHLYGDALVGLYLDVVSSIQVLGRDEIADQNGVLMQCAPRWRVESGDPVTTVLNITHFNGTGRQGHRDFHRYRSNPSLDDALRVLIGSCIICLAILKPSREEELTDVKRHCLREDGNGYWFNSHVGKSNVKGVESWQEADRPIPVITARGIQLLQRLGAGLCEIFGDTTKQASSLFYLPRMDGMGALNADQNLLNLHLDDFCDFVDLAPDSHGRRWYVRIHEMRKWFLLLLFWSGRFDVLDAARWIAGHTDAAHIYAYIEREFPGESLPQIEAQYSEERLRRFAQGQSGGGDGANALYEAVLKHFNVESLTMIPDPEWVGYVRALREADKFHLEPHSIRDEHGTVVGINISFVMRDLS